MRPSAPVHDVVPGTARWRGPAQTIEALAARRVDGLSQRLLCRKSLPRDSRAQAPGLLPWWRPGFDAIKPTGRSRWTPHLTTCPLLRWTMRRDRARRGGAPLATRSWIRRYCAQPKSKPEARFRSRRLSAGMRIDRYGRDRQAQAAREESSNCFQTSSAFGFCFHGSIQERS